MRLQKVTYNFVNYYFLLTFSNASMYWYLVHIYKIIMELLIIPIII